MSATTGPPTQDVGHQLAITKMRQRALDSLGVGVSLEGQPITRVR